MRRWKVESASGGYFAVALARYGVTVNMVSPLMSDGGLMLQTPQEVQDAIREWAESGWTPMRRRGTPGDIAGGHWDSKP